MCNLFFTTFTLFVLLINVVDVRANEGNGEEVFNDHGDVIILDDNNFKEQTQDIQLTLIMFCAPWCGPCQQMFPSFKEAATELKNNDPKVPLMKIDCEANPNTCNEHNIQSYPTLLVFKMGKKANEYEGADRSAASIIEYMKKVAQSSKNSEGSCNKDGSCSGDQCKDDKNNSEEKKGKNNVAE